MNAAALSRRLDKMERARGYQGDLERASDAQLEAIIREGYRDLGAEHGSLAVAAEHYRQTGDTADASLAVYLREEIEAGRA